MGICALSSLWTMTPQNTFYATRGVLEVAIIGNLLIAFIGSDEKIEYILKCFVIAGAALIIRLIITYPFDIWGREQLGNDVYNSNAMGLHLSISAICALYFLLKKGKRKWIFYILIPTLIVAVFLTGSRKAFFFSIAGCILVYIFNVKRKRKLIFIFPVVAFLVYILFTYIMTIPEFYQVMGARVGALLELIKGTREPDASTQIRMLLINRGVDLWKSKPWFGYGIQSFESISGFWTYSHNNYIELLVGIGLVGTAIYYSLYLFLLTKLGKLVFDGITIANLFFIIVVLLIISEIGFVSYGDEAFQILLAVGVACVQIFSKRKLESTNNEILLFQSNGSALR